MCDRCDWELALDDIDSALADSELIPERGEDFAASVQETLNDMRGWIEDNKHATLGHRRAIDNMAQAIENWIH